MAFCPNCGKNVEDGALFCDDCGTRLGEDAQVQTSPDHIYVDYGTPVPPAPAKKKGFDAKKLTDGVKNLFGKLPKNVGKIPTKFLLAGVAGVLVLAIVLSIALPAVLSGGGSQDFILYAKEGEIYHVGNNGKNPWQVTDDLLKRSGWDEDDLDYYSYVLTANMQLRDDGNRLFYLDNINTSSEGIDLYFRYLNNQKKEPVKLDTDVTAFVANEKGTQVTYIAGGDLYTHDLKEETRIAKDVYEFYASADGKTIVYLDDDAKLYSWTAKNGEEKITGNVTDVISVSDDCSKVYYEKDDVLHMYNGKEDTKIATDVYDVIAVLESGEIYYVVDETADVDVMDLIGDKNAADDAAMEEPDWDTIRASYDSYSEASDAYYAAWDLYEEKLERDDLREEIPNYDYSGLFRKLYYYNGKESVAVGDGYVTYTKCASDAAVIAFSTCDYAGTDIDLEDISYASEVNDLFEAADEESCKWFIASGSKVSPVDLEGASYVRCDEEGKTFYFSVHHADEVKVDDYGYETVIDSVEADLYKVAVSGGNAKTAELVDEDIYRSSITVVDSKTVIYFKDRDENYEGDLYINGEAVDEDVSTSSVIVNEKDGSIAYRTDIDDDGLGTLKYYKKGEAQELAEDVRSYYFFPTGELYYLSDYSTKRCYGDLYFFNGRKSVKLDEDVTAMLLVYSI